MFYVVKRSTVAEIKKVTLESWSFCEILFNAIGFKALPLKGKISLKHSAVMIQVDQLILRLKTLLFYAFFMWQPQDPKENF